MLEFSNDTLAVPLVTADPKLIEALQPFCDKAASERSTPKGTLRAAVEKEAERLLPHGKANVETAAKALGLGGRTLSRRLADEGATFGEVVDQLRRSLALQYLKEPGFSLCQIAWLRRRPLALASAPRSKSAIFAKLIFKLGLLIAR